MGRTRGDPDEIKKNTHPKNITALFREQARLKLHRFEAPTVGGELVTLANISKGTAGALLNVRFDAAGLFYGYLEACMRALIDQSTTPLFLSSGAEDYFLSAYYFNEGEFKTPNSGLTYVPVLRTRGRRSCSHAM